MNRRLLALPIAAVYVGSVVLANWLTTRYGFIDVGFGEAATAGTFAAGGALVVRDFCQDTLGRVGVLALIAIAAVVSYIVAAPQIAVASAVAFGCAELLDMAFYTPLRKRGRFGGPWWSRAVLAGAAVGAVLDTVLFLWIAFGWQTVAVGLPGQLLGKAEVILVLLTVGSVVARETRRVSSDSVLREPVHAASA